MLTIAPKKNKIPNIDKVLVKWKLTAKKNLLWKYPLGNLLSTYQMS